MCLYFIKKETKEQSRIRDEVNTYEALDCDSSVAHVFPNVVMATPAMLTKTATTFARFKESWPKNAPMKSVKSPEVEDKTVVLATLVRARAAFEKYCNDQEKP